MRWGVPGGMAPGGGCWMPPRFRRAVVIVIDALRYDFVAHATDAEVGTLSRSEPRARYHLNKVPVVREHTRGVWRREELDTNGCYQIADPDAEVSSF
jgi:hypothetical protein